MSVVPPEEFIQRVVRMMELFPKHIHKICRGYNDYNVEELQSIARKNGIDCTFFEWNFRMSRPGHGYDILEYYPRSFKTLEREIFYVETHTSIAVNYPGMFKDLSTDHPYIPKMQCNILTALFGKEWVNYYKFVIRVEVELSVPALEKIA